MSTRARIVVDAKDGTIQITAPIEASRALLVDAARRAHQVARKLVEERAKGEAHRRDMAGRAAVAELYSRLRSWEKTTAIIAGEDSYDPMLRDLVAAVRRFAESRHLRGDDLDPRQVKRWVREQVRYEITADSDAVFPGWQAHPPAPVPFWGEPNGAGVEGDTPD